MSPRFLSRPPTPRFMAAAVVAMLAFHAVVWIVAVQRAGRPWAEVLNNWDSGWYSSIIINGYSGNAWAFYPLYPACVAALARVPFLSGVPVPLLGAAFSLALFTVFCVLVCRLAARGDTGPAGRLLPETSLGWLVLVLSPASYVFHSHHTESLFLLLSAATFYCCAQRRWLLAATLAGLCALTKNQGIFVAVAAGVWGFAQVRGPVRRTVVFAGMGLLALAIFALYPALQYAQEGDPFVFYKAQHHWRPTMDSSSYLKTLWFGNPWQNTNAGSIQRYITFWVLAGSVALVWMRHRLALALYVALFVGVMPMSGEFVGTFRYGAVLFPSLFVIGDRAAKAPRWVSYLLLAALLYLNHRLARHYILNRWSY